LPLHVAAQESPGLHHRNQLPTLLAEAGQFLLDVHGLEAEELRLDLVDPVLPASAHGESSSLGRSACGRRPALRSASRKTYSICALRLRSSSSAHFCAAASTSAPIRSG